jgi:uncharacterized protein with HEPN domain
MLLDSDRVRIRHMIEAARQAISFVTDRSCDDLAADVQLRLAVLRALEILGEAANRVSPETRTDHQEIPWRLAVSMRNRIVHAYFDIDLGIVWTTITQTLPRLVPMLEAIVRKEGEE